MQYSKRCLQFVNHIWIQVDHWSTEDIKSFHNWRNHGQFGATDMNFVLFVGFQQYDFITFHRVVVVNSFECFNFSFDDVEELEHVNCKYFVKIS